MTYEPFGPLNALTFGNSLSLARDFDTQYRLTAQTTGAIQDLGFTHDSAGNIDAIADGVDPGLDQAFTQDALHRIDLDSGAYGAIDYGYDAAGNTTADAEQGLSFTYDDHNWLILTNRRVVTPGPVRSQAIFLNQEEVNLKPVCRDPVHDFGFYRYDPRVDRQAPDYGPGDYNDFNSGGLAWRPSIGRSRRSGC